LNQTLWTKDFIIIFIANFFVALTFYVLMTTLTLYAVEQFHASQSMAGLASSIFIIGALFSRLFAGKYIEVIGRKKMIYWGLLLFLLTILLYFPVHQLDVLLVVRFIHGVSFGIAANAMSTAVMDMVPLERRGEGTSYYASSATTATAIGPFIGLYITEHTVFSMIFVLCTIFSVISIIFTLFMKVPEATLTEQQLQALKKGFSLQNSLEKKAIPISIIMFLMGIAYSGIVTFLHSYATEFNLTEAAGLFFIVYAVFLLLSRPMTGRLLDVKGDNMVIYPALLLFSLSLLLLHLAHHSFTVLLAGAFTALGFGTFISSAQAIAVKVSPKHRIGLATSTFFICLDGGMGIGPILTGMLIPLVGFRGMYLTLSVFVVLSIILYYFVHGKHVASKQKARVF